MKATGMIRKIDDLGRVVIPKEIRKTLRIREGDPMEIYVEKNGEIILKRFAPLGDIVDEVICLADVLAKNTGFSVYITDTQTILAVNSKSKKGNLDRQITEELLNILEERVVYINKGDNEVKITEKDGPNAYLSQVISPIISDGDIIGSIIFFSEGTRKNPTDTELKMLQVATDFLSNQM